MPDCGPGPLSSPLAAFFVASRMLTLAAVQPQGTLRAGLACARADREAGGAWDPHVNAIEEASAVTEVVPDLRRNAVCVQAVFVLIPVAIQKSQRCPIPASRKH